MRVISNNGVPLKTSHSLWSELIHTCTKASLCSASQKDHLHSWRVLQTTPCDPPATDVQRSSARRTGRKGGLLILAQSLSMVQECIAEDVCISFHISLLFSQMCLYLSV